MLIYKSTCENMKRNNLSAKTQNTGSDYGCPVCLVLRTADNHFIFVYFKFNTGLDIHVCFIALCLNNKKTELDLAHYNLHKARELT